MSESKLKKNYFCLIPIFVWNHSESTASSQTHNDINTFCIKHAPKTSGFQIKLNEFLHGFFCQEEFRLKLFIGQIIKIS